MDKLWLSIAHNGHYHIKLYTKTNVNYTLYKLSYLNIFDTLDDIVNYIKEIKLDNQIKEITLNFDGSLIQYTIDDVISLDLSMKDVKNYIIKKKFLYG